MVPLVDQGGARGDADDSQNDADVHVDGDHDADDTSEADAASTEARPPWPTRSQLGTCPARLSPTPQGAEDTSLLLPWPNQERASLINPGNRIARRCQGLIDFDRF